MLKTGTLGQTHGLNSPASVVQVDHTLALCIPAPMLGPEQSAGYSWFTQYIGAVDGACLLWAYGSVSEYSYMVLWLGV